MASFPSQTAAIVVLWSVYILMLLIRSSARFCFGMDVVVIWKVGAPSGPLGARHVLRTMVERSAIKVEKLCAGLPSSSAWLATFFNLYDLLCQIDANSCNLVHETSPFEGCRLTSKRQSWHLMPLPESGKSLRIRECLQTTAATSATRAALIRVRAWSS